MSRTGADAVPVVYPEWLLCLTEDEYKFLPLWASGMDDGSGGAFQEEIPLIEKGPIGPEPSFHAGSTTNSMARDEDPGTKTPRNKTLVLMYPITMRTKVVPERKSSQE